MDKEKDDELVAMLKSMQEEQQRQGRMIRRQRIEMWILLLLGFGGLYFWMKWPAMCLLAEWFELWSCW